MEMHLENAQTYLDNPAGIGEHPDIMEALLGELKKAAEWKDVVDIIDEMHGPD